MKDLNKILVLILIVSAISILSYLFLNFGINQVIAPGDYEQSVFLKEQKNEQLYDSTLGSADIFLEIADSEEERMKGLSGRDVLPDDHGLLFIFSSSDFHGIWMKEMKFPIDIIWLDSEAKIIDIKENALPSSYPEIFYPKEKASYVVEVNSGFVSKNKIEIGQKMIAGNVLSE